ncbi:MAG: aromatic amino acid lyase, partial [Gemmatimonadetes bacterium]|nr:aromatic amino acid lyase [Gemmatimonadota bacterium]
MLRVDGRQLTLEDVVRVARHREPIEVDPSALEAVKKSREFLDREVGSGRAIYGVNTGVGQLAGVAVDGDALEDLQRNIVRSHASGLGPPLADEDVRAVVLLKLNLFLKGVSGVRVELVHQLEAMLRADVLPVVPAKGSLGASGDLAPLAHVALCVIGEGEARLAGETMPAADALRRQGLEPLALSYKEGLGLINGCQVMAGRGTLILHDGWNLWKLAQIIGAAVLDVFGASEKPFHAAVH